jgi:hypothetical protein
MLEVWHVDSSALPARSSHKIFGRKEGFMVFARRGWLKRYGSEVHGLTAKGG